LDLYIDEKGVWILNIFFIIGILIASLVVAFYFLWRITKNQDDQMRDLLKVGIPLLIPLFALISTVVLPQKTTQIIVPELEKKIDENKKLKKEVQELNTIVSDKEKEQKKSNQKIKDLTEKNYAELSQVNLVVDGLEKKEAKGSIAIVNDKLYLDENILKSTLNTETEISYNEDDKILYIGGSGEKVTKEALSERYTSLYAGENYTSLEEGEEEYKVAGKLIENGFILGSSAYKQKGSYALINTEGAFSSVEFDVGRLDSERNTVEDGKLKIELDTVKKYQETVSAEIASKHYKFDISGAKTLKINMMDSGSEFGFYNVIFNK
jgi:hypothetical protein